MVDVCRKMREKIGRFLECMLKQQKGFCVFWLFQLLILFWAFLGLFGKAVSMELDAGNLEITDEKVIVNTDKSLYVTGRNDAETYGRWIAGTSPFDLREGMYEVSVDYWSLLYDTEVGGNCEDVTGSLQILRSKATEDKLCYNELYFKDGWTSQKTRMWTRNIGGENGLQVKVNFYGVGELRIDRIAIKELPIWRFMKFLAWFLGFAIVDVLYFYFFASPGAKNKQAAAMLVGAVFFTSLPLLTDSLFWGHDIDFHINRIAALANGLEAGHLFVPIQTEVNNGYGYASPLFYSQLFLYIPAVLYRCAVPMQMCYQIYGILINIVTCLIAYYSLNGIVKDRQIAATGAFIYVLSAYRITNLFVRAAVGEYTAMAFFPLVVYGFVRVYTTDEDKLGIRDYFPIVAGLSGLIESHVLSCELAAMFIAVVCLVNFRKTFAVKRFFVLVKAAVLTFLVNAAFLIPFLDSMRMDIRVNSAPVNSIQVHGTYLQQVFGAFQISFGDSRIGMNGEMPLSLGIALVLGVIVFAVCCSMKTEWNVQKNSMFQVGLTCTAFTAVCVILSLRFFPWDSLENMSRLLAKVLCIVQFPWRYLSTASVFATVSTVIGLAIIKRKKGAAVAQLLCGTLCLLSVLSGSLCMAEYTNGIQISRIYGDAEVIQEISTGEYMLVGTIEGNLRWRKVHADENFVAVSDYKYEGGVTSFACRNTADTEMAVEIPLLHYDNYHAYDIATGSELGIMTGTDNRVSIAVPPHFEGGIKVEYQMPLLWKAAYAVSFVSVGFTAAAAAVGKRLKRKA